MSRLTKTRTVPAALAVLTALLLVGCSATPSDDSGSAPDDSASASENGTQQPAEGPTGGGEDFIAIDGVVYPYSPTVTVDPGEHTIARALMPQCEPNLSRTGMFEIWAYLVGDDGKVVYTDKSWAGLVSISLMDREDVEFTPSVDVERNDTGLWLSLSETPPDEIEGEFTIDGNVATGSFMLQDMNGGPSQQIEFQVTCPEDD
ncbi:MAG TPA: hypothetical protein PK781_01970 [Terrimesophilobacter sp.]|nr:hypothetical protein [Terrimesophilobacter sp.]